jgi:hypothetical protein
MSFGLIVEVRLQYILTIGSARECKPPVSSYPMALRTLFGYTDAQPGNAHGSQCGLMIHHTRTPVCAYRLLGETNCLHLHGVFSCNTWCVVFVTFTRF